LPFWRFDPEAKSELKDLPTDARAAVTVAMGRLRHGTSFPRELEHVRGNIWAIRVSFDGCEYRLLYARLGNNSEVLLGLIVLNKKSKKLPRQTIKVAERRLGNWEGRGLARRRRLGR